MRSRQPVGFVVCVWGLCLVLLGILVALACTTRPYGLERFYAPSAPTVQFVQELCTDHDSAACDADPRPLLLLALQRIAHRAGLRAGHNVTVQRAWKSFDDHHVGRETYRWIVDACFYRSDDNTGTCVAGLEVPIDALWGSSIPPTEWPLHIRPSNIVQTLGAEVTAPLGTGNDVVSNSNSNVTYRAQTTDVMLLTTIGVNTID